MSQVSRVIFDKIIADKVAAYNGLLYQDKRAGILDPGLFGRNALAATYGTYQATPFVGAGLGGLAGAGLGYLAGDTTGALLGGIGGAALGGAAASIMNPYTTPKIIETLYA